MADDVPEFPPPKTTGSSIKAMLERDAKSPWHKAWGGGTSAELRPTATGEFQLDQEKKNPAG